MPGDKFWEILPQLKGSQLWVALCVMVLVLLFFAFKHLLAPGTETLAARREERRGEAEAWKYQTLRMEDENKVLAAELRIEQKRVWRFSTTLEHTRGLLFRVLDSCSDAPAEVREEANQLPTSEAILQEE